MAEPRHRIRFGPPHKDHRVDRVHVLLRPPIPGGVDEVGLAPDPDGRMILIAAEADEVERRFHRRSDPLISRNAPDAGICHQLRTAPIDGVIMSAEDNDEDAGKSWAEILEKRSPEGRSVVLQLNQAELACVEVRDRLTLAMLAHRDCTADLAAMEDAMDEVSRLRKEVYRMARQ